MKLEIFKSRRYSFAALSLCFLTLLSLTGCHLRAAPEPTPQPPGPELPGNTWLIGLYLPAGARGGGASLSFAVYDETTRTIMEQYPLDADTAPQVKTNDVSLITSRDGQYYLNGTILPYDHNKPGPKPPSIEVYAIENTRVPITLRFPESSLKTMAPDASDFHLDGQAFDPRTPNGINVVASSGNRLSLWRFDPRAPNEPPIKLQELGPDSAEGYPTKYVFNPTSAELMSATEALPTEPLPYTVAIPSDDGVYEGAGLSGKPLKFSISTDPAPNYKPDSNWGNAQLHVESVDGSGTAVIPIQSKARISFVRSSASPSKL